MINFVIMAFVIFLFLKLINKLTSIGKEEKPQAAPTTKKCQFCCTDIPIAATRCPHCTSVVESKENDDIKEETCD